MTREDVLIIFDKLLDNNQESYTYGDSKEKLLHKLAYNDGLIDMRDAIIIRIDNEANEAVENEK